MHFAGGKEFIVRFCKRFGKDFVLIHFYARLPNFKSSDLGRGEQRQCHWEGGELGSRLASTESETAANYERLGLGFRSRPVVIRIYRGF